AKGVRPLLALHALRHRSGRATHFWLHPRAASLRRGAHSFPPGYNPFTRSPPKEVAPMAAKPKVFVTLRIPAAGLDHITRQCDAEGWPDQLSPPHEVLKEKVAAADGLVSLLTDRIDAALLNGSPRLKVVSNYAVGFNNIDVDAATALGIAVGNTPGVLTDATA